MREGRKRNLLGDGLDPTRGCREGAPHSLSMCFGQCRGWKRGGSQKSSRSVAQQKHLAGFQNSDIRNSSGCSQTSMVCQAPQVIKRATLCGQALEQGSQNLPLQEAPHSHPSLTPLTLQSHNWFPAEQRQWLLRSPSLRKTNAE